MCPGVVDLSRGTGSTWGLARHANSRPRPDLVGWGSASPPGNPNGPLAGFLSLGGVHILGWVTLCWRPSCAL